MQTRRLTTLHTSCRQLATSIVTINLVNVRSSRRLVFSLIVVCFLCFRDSYHTWPSLCARGCLAKIARVTGERLPVCSCCAPTLKIKIELRGGSIDLRMLQNVV